MPKLSIILPVYNSANFLQKVFDSLQGQIEKNLEMIFVNDGSTDGSLEICRRLAERDSRVVVKDKENGGVSSARNLGMECATGEFVAFLDPDDYIDKKMYLNMLECTNEETDIVISGFIHEYEKKSIVIKMPQDMKATYRGNDIYTEILSRFILYGKGLGHLPQMGTVWRMIFRREFLQGNDLKFLPFACQDDWLFALSALKKANLVGIEKGAYYHYVHYKGSVTGKYRPEYPIACIAVLEELNRIGVFDFIPEKYEHNPNLAFFFLIFIINRIVMQKKSLFAIKKELLEILSSDCFNLEKIHISRCTGKHKPVLILLKFGLLLPLLSIYKIKDYAHG